MNRLKQALVMARMPTLAAVGLLLTIWGAQGNEATMLGAGLVIVGLWSGAAVAELFTVVARPAGGSGSGSDGDDDDEERLT